MTMSLNDLKIEMRIHICALNARCSDPSEVPVDVKFSELLPTGGAGTAISPRIFKSFIRYSLIQAGNGDKPWPKNGQNLTIDKLAPKII